MGEALRVVVCVKPVPDAGGEVAFDPQTGAPDRRGRLVLDDADAVGVEVGLRLAAAGAGAGVVSVVAMTPESGLAAVRTALAMGADQATVVVDDALAGSDALSSAKVLASVIGAGGFDVVVAATESTDASAGVVPVQLAQLLGIPALGFARRVELAGDGGEVRVERVTEEGWDEVVCPLPCLVTVTADAATPRYPSVARTMRARSLPLTVVGLADVGIDPSSVGWAGARQRVVSVHPAPRPPVGELVDDPAEAHQRVLALLGELGLA